MCKWGILATQVKLHTPKSDGRTYAPVDPCIAPLVQVLNDGGVKTTAACCGHGHRPGTILLDDDRWLFIASDWEEGSKIDKIHSKAGYRSIGGEEMK